LPWKHKSYLFFHIKKISFYFLLFTIKKESQ
jgi:hypothetical protein